MEKRPNFNEIQSYNEFSKYYWYREELAEICKELGISYSGTKQELNYVIEEYFKNHLIKEQRMKHNYKTIDTLRLDVPLLKCGFSFNSKFRDYFSKKRSEKYDSSALCRRSIAYEPVVVC